MAPEPFDAEDVLMEAIRERLFDRRWYRCQPRPMTWRDLGRENDIALRALVAVARRARRLAPAPDPMTQAAAYDDWAETELREAFGR